MANPIWLVLALLTPLAWIIVAVAELGDAFGTLGVAVLAGLGIAGSAFLLTWATELAEEDVPPALALIVLALISVLPEYAVDMHFAWVAGKDP